MLLSYRDVDRGHILEIVVYFELLLRGYDDSIGKAGEKEVDLLNLLLNDRLYL